VTSLRAIVDGGGWTFWRGQLTSIAMGELRLGDAEGDAELLAHQPDAQAGRTLLPLDIETGSAGDRLHKRCRGTEVGVVPDHSLARDGRLAVATVLYDLFGADRRPPTGAR
jgi:hypothetical protein